MDMLKALVCSHPWMVENEQILMLVERLQNAQSTIIELEAQRNEALRLLNQSRLRLLDCHTLFSGLAEDTNEIPTGHNSPTLAAVHETSDWILRNWCVCNGPLAEAEDLCRGKHWQQALAKLDHMLAPTSRWSDEVEVLVNCRLLKARILGQFKLFPEAIACCEEALKLANMSRLYQIRGKIHFHLGTLYYEDGRLLDARTAFGMATHTNHHQDQVQVWKERCDADIGNLSVQDYTALAYPKVGPFGVHRTIERMGQGRDVQIEALEDIWKGI